MRESRKQVCNICACIQFYVHWYVIQLRQTWSHPLLANWPWGNHLEDYCLDYFLFQYKFS
jgi:hypothetical protein